MKIIRIIRCVIALSFAFTTVVAQAKEETPASSLRPCVVKSSPTFEIKGGYFFFASNVMKEVYSNGGFEIQASGAYPVWQCLQIYGSVGFLEAWGHSKGFHQVTNIWEIPVDVGLKPVFTIASFAKYYLALGPRYFYVHQHNDSSYVNPNIARNGVGFFVNTGFNFFPVKHFFIDVFGEYAYESADFSSSKNNVYARHAQLSKVSFGAGFGYSF